MAKFKERRTATPVTRRYANEISMGCAAIELMTNLTQAIAHLQFPQKQRLNLMTLPQEIQDIIFDYAYPTIKGFKFITIADWQDREQEKYRRDPQGYTARPLPESKAIDFLVSKQYFASAARAFVGNQICNDSTESERRTFRFMSTERGGVIIPFMKTATLGRFDLKVLTRIPPNLKDVSVPITPEDFRIIEPKLAWRDDLDDGEFKAVIAKTKLSRLSGLHKLRLITKECKYATTEAEATKWQENVRKLEAFATPYVQRPKAGEDMDTDSNDSDTENSYDGLRSRNAKPTAPLYLGSKVSFGSSKVGREGRTLPTGKKSDTFTSKATTLHMLGTHSAHEVGMQNTKKSPLRLRDVPDRVDELQLLVYTDGDRLAELIRELKKEKEVAGLL